MHAVTISLPRLFWWRRLNDPPESQLVQPYAGLQVLLLRPSITSNIPALFPVRVNSLQQKLHFSRRSIKLHTLDPTSTRETNVLVYTLRIVWCIHSLATRIFAHAHIAIFDLLAWELISPVNDRCWITEWFCSFYSALNSLRLGRVFQEADKSSIEMSRLLFISDSAVCIDSCLDPPSRWHCSACVYCVWVRAARVFISSSGGLDVIDNRYEKCFHLRNAAKNGVSTLDVRFASPQL